MAKMLLHLDIGEDFHAGSKAMKDCETVFIEKGYELLRLQRREGKTGILAKLQNEIQFGKFFSLKKGDILAVQHPLYIGTRYMKWLKLAKKMKGFKTIFVIHDLESLRKLFKDWAELFEELDSLMLETADVLIVHNPCMMEYLRKERKVLPEKMVSLGVFDYLTEEKPVRAEGEQADIAIAGNFAPEKSGYVYKMLDNPVSYKLNLYGIGYEEKKEYTGTVCHKGAFPADILPGKIEGKYGLVWDGQDIETCTGTTGEYVKYNNPHKVSLYIASELPIIIWQEAALAGFVKENNIGITISSLKELDEKISRITDEQYKKMKENIKPISEKVRKGGFVLQAVETAESRLKE